LVEDFVGVSEEERGRAVERWFVVEDDVRTIAQEVDMVLTGEDEDQRSSRAAFFLTFV